MKRIVAISLCMCALAASPASAQHMAHKMMAPTMDQCHDGYKRMYMKSMHWSRATFNRACHKMMMKKHM